MEARKSVRDAVTVGGATSLAAGLMLHYGVDPIVAGLLAPVFGGFVAGAYRIARRRWPALQEFDPGAADSG